MTKKMQVGTLETLTAGELASVTGAARWGGGGNKGWKARPPRPGKNRPRPGGRPG